MSLTKKDISIGCDPEFFLFDTTLNKHVSAHGLVPGNKKEPYKLKKGAVQLDGTAVEFNINPTNCSKEFAENIKSVLGEIRTMIPKKYEFSFTPAIIYDKPYFESIPPECLVLGCEPDYSSYTGKIKVMPKFSAKSDEHRMRTGAGHIHVGWTSGVKEPHAGFHFEDAKNISMYLDALFVSYGHSNLWETQNNNRKKLYGGDGAFRPKPYGLEYRAPSNCWVRYPNMYKFIGALVQDYVYELHDKGTGALNFYPYIYNSISILNDRSFKDRKFISDYRHYMGRIQEKHIYSEKLPPIEEAYTIYKG